MHRKEVICGFPRLRRRHSGSKCPCTEGKLLKSSPPFSASASPAESEVASFSLKRG